MHSYAVAFRIQYYGHVAVFRGYFSFRNKYLTPSVLHFIKNLLNIRICIQVNKRSFCSRRLVKTTTIAQSTAYTTHVLQRKHSHFYFREIGGYHADTEYHFVEFLCPVKI